MKQIIVYFFARFFNWFKVKSPVMYTALMSALVYAQAELADPDVMHDITEALDGAPKFVFRIIKWLPSILMALAGPHTTELVKRGRSGKSRDL